MKPASRRLCATGITTLAVYLAFYILLRAATPGFAVSNQGSHPAFDVVFYPLRYLDSAKPDWYWEGLQHSDTVVATVAYHNRGNGFLYFTWRGRELRAFLGGGQSDFQPDDQVRLHFRYRIETDETLHSRLIESIDQIELQARFSTKL